MYFGLYFFTLLLYVWSLRLGSRQVKFIQISSHYETFKQHYVKKKPIRLNYKKQSRTRIDSPDAISICNSVHARVTHPFEIKLKESGFFFCILCDNRPVQFEILWQFLRRKYRLNLSFRFLSINLLHAKQVLDIIFTYPWINLKLLIKLLEGCFTV